AFAAIQYIKAESNLRQSAAFRKIAASWADHQLEQVEDSSNVDAQRRLLDAVSRSESVDPSRRRRAADLLAQLNAASLDPSDLPEAMAEEDDDAGVEPLVTESIHEAVVEEVIGDEI